MHKTPTREKVEQMRHVEAWMATGSQNASRRADGGYTTSTGATTQAARAKPPSASEGTKTGAAKGIEDTEITLRMLFPAPTFRDAKIISCVTLEPSGMQWKTKPG